jgi:hypothetical protein
MLSVREIVEGNSYPEKGAITLNEVSPAFIRAVIRTAVGDSSKEWINQ